GCLAKTSEADAGILRALASTWDEAGAVHRIRIPGNWPRKSTRFVWGTSSQHSFCSKSEILIFSLTPAAIFAAAFYLPASKCMALDRPVVLPKLPRCPAPKQTNAGMRTATRERWRFYANRSHI